ncbi:MAG TPA: DNA repair protein RadA [Nitrospirae bacterium]|nr:DNA repair protein RadA [Nitrospirota bacterium]
MSKEKISFVCQSCGYNSPRWLGKCPECSSWNSLAEERQVSQKLVSFSISEPLLLNEIKEGQKSRLTTGIRELDRVLGGGVVYGAVILLGGDPGIGKSTLVIQAMNNLSKQYGSVLYVSGEESPEQIKLRASRLNISSDRIIVFSETKIESIINHTRKIKPKAVVIDSIQTVYTEDILSAPGSVGQIRESASKLMFFAKKEGIPVFIIGHVTKEGAIAGPRVLEHIVDTVLYFEGDSSHSYRILRTMKNRFGSTNEIGLFEMTDEGLREVENPSEILIAERPSDASGSAVIPSIRGTRPILVEIQALVSPTPFGIPRRTTMGIDPNRTGILVAVLEKKAGLQLSVMDIFVNVAGGLKIPEPASDLGLISAIVSSFRDTPLEKEAVFFGEIGLSGEVRAVSQAEARIKESVKVGFKKAYIPMSNRDRLKNDEGLEIVGIRKINELLEIISI